MNMSCDAPTDIRADMGARVKRHVLVYVGAPTGTSSKFYSSMQNVPGALSGTHRYGSGIDHSSQLARWSFGAWRAGELALHTRIFISADSFPGTCYVCIKLYMMMWLPTIHCCDSDDHNIGLDALQPSAFTQMQP